MVYKANELVVSRYDLTEQETYLILYGVARLNPMLENPTEEQRTIYIPYDIYAEKMGGSEELAWHNLNNAVKNIMSRTITLINPDPNIPIERRIFQWVNRADFNKDTQQVELVFSNEIQPYLFNLKEFIKYKLENVKSLNNKYSMRMYEILLKSLSEKKAIQAEVLLSLDSLKEMLMLETSTSYANYKEFNRRVLKPAIDDVNVNSDLRVSYTTQGRPAKTLVFYVEKEQQLNSVKEPDKQQTAKEQISQSLKEKKYYDKVESLLNYHSVGAIVIEHTKSLVFLQSVKAKYEEKGYYHFNEKQYKWVDDLYTKYAINRTKKR